ncbi:MAG: methyl-accepting chemotaxis protein [Clostridia bacterium]|nr:methyl-accepting chemotaxis protein [Clostridia bacterium]
MKKSFKFRLALYFGLIILVASVSIGASLTMMSANKMESIRNESSEVIVKEIRESISNYLLSFSSGIDMLSMDSNVKSAPTYADSMTWMMRTFESFSKAYPEASFVYIGYENPNAFDVNVAREKMKDFYGTAKIDSSEYAYEEAAYNSTKGFFTYPHFKASPEYQPKQRGWYALAKTSTEVVWTDTYIDAFTGLPVVTAAKQVFDDNNKMIGVISTDLSLGAIANTYKDTTVGNTGVLVIADSIGNVISHPDPEWLGKNVSEEPYWAEMANQDSGYVKYSSEGTDKYLYFMTEPTSGWKIAVPFEADEIAIDTKPLVVSSIGIILAALLAGIGVGTYIASRVTGDLQKVNHTLSLVAVGDLTERVNMNRGDEIGQMADNLNRTVDTLREIVHEINVTSDSVKNDSDMLTQSISETTRATEEIANSIQDVAKGTNQQADEVLNGSNKTAAVGEKISEVNNLSNAMGLLSDEVKGESSKGLTTMKELTAKAEEKEKSSAYLSEMINNVDEQSKKIGEITDTISSIADQTNLLALNASIESARAGEAGRGFAVVAEEIRKLAEQSSEASDDIRGLISDMQRQSGMAVKTVENNRQVEIEEYSAVKETEASFNKIFETLEKLLASIDGIKQQNNEIESDSSVLLDVMSNVSAITEETSAASEQVSAATEEQLASMQEIASQTDHLRESVENLHNLILKFKIK